MRSERNEFTKLAVRYPVRTALASGAFLVVISTLEISRRKGFAIGAWWGLSLGAAFAVIQWVLWRPGGWGPRHEPDVGDEPVNWTPIVQTFILTAVLTVLMILAYLLAG
jgi:hypothetical protein